MDKQTILIEAPHHKTEDTFFTTIDGRIWLLFGCTDSVVLARLCYMVDGQIHFAPLSSIEYNQFGDWTEDTKSDNRLNLSGRTMDDTNGQTTTKQTANRLATLAVDTFRSINQIDEDCYSSRYVVSRSKAYLVAGYLDDAQEIAELWWGKTTVRRILLSVG